MADAHPRVLLRRQLRQRHRRRCVPRLGRPRLRRGPQNGVDLTCYNLGIRGDTSADVLRRWEHEARARLPPEHDGRLVFSFGANDCCLRDDASQVRVPLDQALANARAILGSALAWRPTLMVGPLPICDRETDGGSRRCRQHLLRSVPRSACHISMCSITPPIHQPGPARLRRVTAHIPMGLAIPLSAMRFSVGWPAPAH